MSDADDWRVKKSDGSILWYDPAGTHQLADVFDTSGNLEAEYYYLGGLLIASRAHFYYSDRLETVRVMTDVTGNVQFESDFYPFGGEVVVSGSQNTDTQNKLIGRRRDTDLSTAFDYAHLRMYNSAMGRWLQTDPADADPTDPQSLNRYNYVGNSPTNFADPTGGDKVVATFTFSITAWGRAFGPPSIYEGSVGQFGDPFGGLGRYPIFQIERRGAARRHTRAAKNGTPQQPTKTQERLERLKNCALGYYGIDPLSVSGLTSNGAKWGLIAAGAGGIPKAIPEGLGLVRTIRPPGSSSFTSLFSIVSATSGGGALRTVANFGSKWAGPIAIASAVIDATAIGICTAMD